jgi:hypothetical protein
MALRRFGRAFMRACAGRDRAVLSDGQQGTARGVATDGALLVHTAAACSAITSSEVSVRPALPLKPESAMLRLIVLLLLLANGLYFAWSHGLLQAYGLAPVQQAEPQRLTQQLHPERLRLLGADEVKRLEAATAQSSLPPRPTECLQAGLFDERQATALRQALDTALPQGSWEFENGVEPERWIVYMGKYPDNDTLNKKLAELRSLNIRFEPLSNPALSPGLSLAAYPSEAAAKEGLAQFASRGVRTARVVQERAELRGQWLRLPQADASLKQRLDNLKAALAGKALRPCQKPSTPAATPS